MTTADYYEADFPEWALCALVNGDPIEDADGRSAYWTWAGGMAVDGYDVVSPEVTGERSEFCANPAFGLASSTVKVRFRKKGERASDEEIAKLDRPGVWMRAWEVRGAGSDSQAGIRRARALIRRWEKLTGRRYYGK